MEFSEEKEFAGENGQGMMARGGEMGDGCWMLDLQSWLAGWLDGLGRILYNIFIKFII
jgi:hypothetical protein